MWIVLPAAALTVLIGVLLAPIPTWVKFTLLAVCAAVAFIITRPDHPGGPPCCGG